MRSFIVSLHPMRVYPNILNYMEALKECLVCDDSGCPVYFAGNRSVVFKAECGGAVRALKCYTLDEPSRRERYAELSDALAGTPLGIFVKYDYLDDYVVCADQNGSVGRFDCVAMEWVRGRSLTSALSEAAYFNRKEEIAGLALRFLLLASELLRSPYVHCDIKPDNIMVRDDGSMVIVDLDPVRLKGDVRPRTETGTPGYRHPSAGGLRRVDHCDDYPLVVVAVTLFALAEVPELWGGDADRVVFDPDECVAGYSRRVAEFAERWSNRPYLLCLLDMLLSQGAAIYGVAAAVERAAVCIAGVGMLGRDVYLSELFDDVVDCGDGMVLVSLAGQWGYLTRDGVRRFYPMALPFSDGAAVVSEGDGVWCAIDRAQNVLFRVECEELGSYSEGLAPIKIDGVWGYADRDGKVAVKPEYDCCYAFSYGCAIVRTGERYGVIDGDGTMLRPMSETVIVRGENGGIVAL